MPAQARKRGVVVSKLVGSTAQQMLGLFSILFGAWDLSAAGYFGYSRHRSSGVAYQ
jgi:hypothetical protein